MIIDKQLIKRHDNVIVLKSSKLDQGYPLVEDGTWLRKKANDLVISWIAVIVTLINALSTKHYNR